MHGVYGFGDLLHGLEGSHCEQVTWQEFWDTEQFFLRQRETNQVG